mgnify:CR=1 FL=1
MKTTSFIRNISLFQKKKTKTKTKLARAMKEGKMEQTQMLELTARKVQELNDQPVVESFMHISKDGKWFVHKTVITDIKPMSYIKTVMDNE